jgi:hypothetical protein
VAVTRDAAATVVAATNSLIERGIDRAQAQRFTTQCVMAMFAEDVGLLPQHMFTRAIEDATSAKSAYDLVFGLFREMDTPGLTPGGRYAGTPYFNGWLFRTVTPFELTTAELHALHTAAQQDWSAVRPEIFGTLFEQSMGKDERHAYGAHFTSATDIQRVVLPSIVRPWRTAIEDAQDAKELAELEQRLLSYRVLDPSSLMSHRRCDRATKFNASHSMTITASGFCSPRCTRSGSRVAAAGWRSGFDTRPTPSSTHFRGRKIGHAPGGGVGDGVCVSLGCCSS